MALAEFKAIRRLSRQSSFLCLTSYCIEVMDAALLNCSVQSWESMCNDILKEP